MGSCDKGWGYRSLNPDDLGIMLTEEYIFSN